MQVVFYSQITRDAGGIIFSNHLRRRKYFILNLLATQEVFYSQITRNADGFLFSNYSQHNYYRDTTHWILFNENNACMFRAKCTYHLPVFLHLFYGDDSGYDTFYSSKYVWFSVFLKYKTSVTNLRIIFLLNKNFMMCSSFGLKNTIPPSCDGDSRSASSLTTEGPYPISRGTVGMGT